MANALDWAARAILQINGMTPEQITYQARRLKAGQGKKPMPKANTQAPQPAEAKPSIRRTRIQGSVKPGAVYRSTQAGRPRTAEAPKAKPAIRLPNSEAQGRNLIREGANNLRQPKRPTPPTPGSTQVKGQTNLFSQNGNARDFRNPNVSANRAPTTTPINHKPAQQLNPKPQRPPAPGQGNLFGNNPSAKPSGNFRAPNVPKPQQAQTPKPQQAQTPKPTSAARPNTNAAGNVRSAIANNAATGSLTRRGIIPALALSNFGLQGESPDVRARALGFKNAADQARRVAEAQRRQGGSSSTRTPSGEYQRPKPNVKPPSAATQATDKRDKTKLF
jgi:hypothetical protein